MAMILTARRVPDAASGSGRACGGGDPSALIPARRAHKLAAAGASTPHCQTVSQKAGLPTRGPATPHVGGPTVDELWSGVSAFHQPLSEIRGGSG